MRKIPFAKIDCSGNELQYVKEVIDSGWLTTAGKAKELEDKFAQAINVKYAFAVNSCTSALHLALDALNVGPNDKVFVPTMTFTASAEVIRYMGADPVFLDVDFATALLTPEILEKAIQKNPNVKVLIVVHYAGQSVDMNPQSEKSIYSICKNNNIKIIEDAAHAFPARDAEHRVGGLGDIACFSFYANKTMTTGEGGIVATNDEELAKRLKLMRLHGINRDVWDRFTSQKANWEYDVVAPGFKYNMPDINAAIGLAQLERVYEMRDQRQRCAEFYLDKLKDFKHLNLPVARVASEDHAWHLFPVTLRETSPVSRNRIIELLAADEIGTSVHYKPLHQMTYYKIQYDLKSEDYPNAERIWRSCFSLPIYPGLSEDDLGYIIERLSVHLKE
ncbi:MAG: DegT/DnrJ/EryC1/StrS family aminotransferase [Gammaproteobacteria bacterium]|nr:MAG: DegT/DnrJ/EryC1/StrS family aminotransferase [Gammaproteobacteria bacterium]